MRLIRRQQGLEDRPTFSAISATERAASLDEVEDFRVDGVELGGHVLLSLVEF
jgi:hypothetical protein